ncbi:unnamed protein product [Ambrosiozyma monospora]|uniref:Unnamed protein product n=1 Tax=Ambrosiozyma monospora TaxID=43982 RepID=A0ACB5SQU8_AMBMO|nr:unnamed protein product [Ambrosiozyma monospora]
MKFSLLLTLAGSTLAAQFYETMIPAGSTIGNPNPTATYNIELLTFGNDKMLAKRNDYNGYCGTSTSVYDVPTSSVWIFSWTTDGQVITATYTDHYSVPTTAYIPWCVGGAPPTQAKRDVTHDPGVFCGTDTYEVVNTSTVMATYESDGVEVVSAYPTVTTFTTTETDMWCVGGAPPTTAGSYHEKRQPVEDNERTCHTYTVTTDSDGVPTPTVSSICYFEPDFRCTTSTVTSEVVTTSYGYTTTKAVGAPIVTIPITQTETFKTTITKAECVGGAPEQSPVPVVEKRDDTGYGVTARIGGSVFDDDGSLTGNCVDPNFTFSNGVISDEYGHVGFIASNGQFMFAGPPPQDGTLYGAGWSITDDYFLALVDQTTFYACKADDDGNYDIFYNKIYDSCIQVMAKLHSDSCVYH